MIVGGIAMGNVPADGSPIAHLRVGNQSGGIGENRIPLPDDVRFFELDFPCERSNFEKASLFFDVRQPGDVVNVDNVAR